MSQEHNKNQYDIISVSRAGSEKRANFIQNANHIEKQLKSSGQFVRVFADVFLKYEIRGNLK